MPIIFYYLSSPFASAIPSGRWLHFYPFTSSSPVETGSSNSGRLKPSTVLAPYQSPPLPLSLHWQQQATVSSITLPPSPSPPTPPPPAPRLTTARSLGFSLCTVAALPSPHVPSRPHVPPLTSLQATEIRSGCSLTSAACRLSSVNLIP